MSAIELLPPPSAAVDSAKLARVTQDVTRALGDLTRAATGGRVTLDTSQTMAGFGGAGMFAYLPPPSAEQNWRTLDLDLVSLERLPPQKLAELVADLSPEASGAINDWLRFCNPGHDVIVTDPRSGKPHKRGQIAIDDFLGVLTDIHGSIDVLYNRLYLGGYMRGAYMSELVADQRGRVPLDIATPDPATARFRRVMHPERGEIYQLGQSQGGRWIPLDRPTVRYIPIDPFPGSPYGRPMISAALFLSLFVLGLLRDVRRVVAQQGYPRLDVEIDVQRLFNSIPQHLQDLDAFGGWLVQVVGQVTTAYANVKPEDAYVHLDAIKVNHPKGALGTESLGAFDGLVGVIERGLGRALKTSPLIMGITEGTSEAQANRQWEIHAARVKSAQHPVESMIGRQYSLALEMQGIDAVVALRFAELRSAELLRDEQVKAQRLTNARMAYEDGTINQAERAKYTWDKDEPDQEEPRVMSGGGAATATPVADGAQSNPEPGSARALVDFGRKLRASYIDPLAYQLRDDESLPVVLELPDGTTVAARITGGADALPAVPAKVPVAAADADAALVDWDDAVPDYAGLLDATVVEE